MSTTKTLGKFTAEITRTDDSVLCDITSGKHHASLSLCSDLGTVGEEPGAPAIPDEVLEIFETWATKQGW